MSEAAAGIVIAGSSSLPSIFTARPEARRRLRDFFSSHIRNRNRGVPIWKQRERALIALMAYNLRTGRCRA